MSWQFDNAVNLFGTWVQNKLDERDKKGKPKHKIEKLLLPVKERAKRRAVSVQDFMSRGVPVTYVRAQSDGS